MKKTILFFIVVVAFSLTGCKKYLDVNKNIDAPDHVDGYLYLAGIQQQYEGIYWDTRAIGALTQMMGTNSSTYSTYALNSYIPGNDAAGETWRMVYWNQGMNLENLINQSLAAEDWTLAGIGYAIKAFSWDLMAKVNVDAPMKEAFVPGVLTHNYDYEKDIYAQVRAWAYKAIELLEKTDDHIYGTKITANDYIFGGDKSKWIKFAYAVIVRNLSSLSNKTDFSSSYAQELITAAGKSFQNPDDDATLKIAGGSQSAPYSDYNNFWGTANANLSYTYFQHEYAVQLFTGTVPEYDESTGEKVRGVEGNTYYPYKLAADQIVTDTLKNSMGHYDPRVAVKLGTTSNPTFLNQDNADSVKAYRYYGGTFTSTAGPIGTAPSYYGRNAASLYSGTVHDGIGRWIYRDDAPYILTTYAEIQFCLAEAYWKLGKKAEAFAAFKEGVKADMVTTGRYIYPGKAGSATGGDKISKSLFASLADQYVSGPFVNGLANFTLSHIMIQKWIALYPWGAPEAWVDLRKYNYDIKYSGDYPKSGNGWTATMVDQKWDSDPQKVYKGFYLMPAQVQGRKGSYDIKNQGAPCYRLRPRYNSEYMWNKGSLSALKPIPGTADNYQTSIPWFAYPGELPN
ncbi:SusD/RagB family nutrient-binding outer membrane lipoprotein [Niabella drilacis]|uniref:Starch-binding associating with outer membrane n=1 Tax=Niabella drilacis (strain DSM 25811 / CCM 8410 / CCUG 62505 / LMG 26954 / E90) TaxID=1285928 RepID=A0A1G7AUS3_NIADE|nr:SusD/RagB family nutrient-binding outer membrane lipoprotein [Niabella drilacis]SDE18618.1 Starch-binding associating with outer membrane [Niabella drilacis]